MMQEDSNNHHNNNQITSQQRTDSPFPALGDEDDDEDEDPNNNSSLSLEEENERLRQELHKYKVKVALLQGKISKKQYQHQQNNNGSPPKKSNTSLLLELPVTLRQAAQRKFCNSPKDHQSLSTEDGQDEIEPNMELEIHESAAGLHHRSGNGGSTHQQNQNYLSLKTTTPSKSTSPKTRKTTTTDTTASNDSFSSTEFTLEEGLEVESQEFLLSSSSRSRTQHNAAAEEGDDSFYMALSDRAGWLVGLLVLQSMSSFILARNEALLERHMIIIQFLTMLVGAGGNAGNQASVRGTYCIYYTILWKSNERKNQSTDASPHSLTIPSTLHYSHSRISGRKY
jgi:hypothetical protein